MRVARHHQAECAARQRLVKRHRCPGQLRVPAQHRLLVVLLCSGRCDVRRKLHRTARVGFHARHGDRALKPGHPARVDIELKQTGRTGVDVDVALPGARQRGRRTQHHLIVVILESGRCHRPTVQRRCAEGVRKQTRRVHRAPERRSPGRQHRQLPERRRCAQSSLRLDGAAARTEREPPRPVDLLVDGQRAAAGLDQCLLEQAEVLLHRKCPGPVRAPQGEFVEPGQRNRLKLGLGKIQLPVQAGGPEEGHVCRRRAGPELESARPCDSARAAVEQHLVGQQRQVVGAGPERLGHRQSPTRLQRTAAEQFHHLGVSLVAGRAHRDCGPAQGTNHGLLNNAGDVGAFCNQERRQRRGETERPNQLGRSKRVEGQSFVPIDGTINPKELAGACRHRRHIFIKDVVARRQRGVRHEHHRPRHDEVAFAVRAADIEASNTRPEGRIRLLAQDQRLLVYKRVVLQEPDRHIQRVLCDCQGADIGDAFITAQKLELAVGTQCEVVTRSVHGAVDNDRAVNRRRVHVVLRINPVRTPQLGVRHELPLTVFAAHDFDRQVGRGGSQIIVAVAVKTDRHGVHCCPVDPGKIALSHVQTQDSLVIRSVDHDFAEVGHLGAGHRVDKKTLEVGQRLGRGIQPVVHIHLQSTCPDNISLSCTVDLSIELDG